MTALVSQEIRRETGTRADAARADILSQCAAAIFDLDGTLADSMGVWDGLCAAWLRRRGRTPAAGLEEAVAAMTLRQAAAYVVAAYGLDIPPEQAANDWEETVLRAYREAVRLKAGAATLIRTLRAGGLKLAVATSCFPAACEAFLTRCGLRDCFDAVVYADQAPRSKRFPDIFLACAEKLDVPPEACVVFEDFPEAAQGVRAAGMRFAAVYDAAWKDWETLQAEADWAFVSF
jgi:HAD superfamily hydrolase (TIGR01509 family)